MADQQERVDNHAWFWRVLGSTVIGTLFSVATVFAVSFLNTVNASLSNVNTNCQTIQGQVGQVQGQVNGMFAGLQLLRTDHGKLNDQVVAQAAETQKQIADFRERITRLEMRVQELETKVTALSKPPELVPPTPAAVTPPKK